MRGVLGLIFLVLLTAGVVALFLRLFWPKAGKEPGVSDNWAQHNELRSPSLENSAESRDNSIDTAVLSQIVGD